ncbi:unnamed protein product [Paramecium octaurelia]|uniref:Tetratricopeptide repeat protein n=1 Tax=Paramecium octaurelia TaxID=43137 RepID=A0A8S1YNW4_PAROT|nr:unnamed protein product [Paramecium octaurelia]
MEQQGQLIFKNHNLGFTLDKLNKYQEAIECYDKAIAINPKFDNAWNNKGSQSLKIIIQDWHYKI